MPTPPTENRQVCGIKPEPTSESILDVPTPRFVTHGHKFIGPPPPTCRRSHPSRLVWIKTEIRKIEELGLNVVKFLIRYCDFAAVILILVGMFC